MLRSMLVFTLSGDIIYGSVRIRNVMRVFALFFLLLLVHIDLSAADRYNVTWNSLFPEPGKNVAGGATYQNMMPIGNGHVAVNVMYESADHTVTCLIAATSAWSEAGELLKVRWCPRAREQTSSLKAQI